MLQYSLGVARQRASNEYPQHTLEKQENKYIDTHCYLELHGVHVDTNIKTKSPFIF